MATLIFHPPAPGLPETYRRRLERAIEQFLRAAARHVPTSEYAPRNIHLEAADQPDGSLHIHGDITSIGWLLVRLQSANLQGFPVHTDNDAEFDALRAGGHDRLFPLMLNGLLSFQVDEKRRREQEGPQKLSA
jgi:hypothetical protein